VENEVWRKAVGRVVVRVIRETRPRLGAVRVNALTREGRVGM